MQTMYTAMINSPVTTLASGIDTTQTTITVTDGNKLPAAPNLATLGVGENAETILYTGKTGNTLTVTRGFQGTARAWSAGTQIGRFFTAYDHDAFVKNIKDHTSNTSNPHGVTPAQIGAETPAGAQTKADQAEEKAKTYANNKFLSRDGSTFMTGSFLTNVGSFDGGTPHWYLRSIEGSSRVGIGLDGADGSGNSGSIFTIWAYKNDGNFLRTLLSIPRDSLAARINEKLIWHEANSGPFYKGAGSPEGVVSAPVGAIYQRTDGGANTTLYVKQSNAGGNTGWVAK
ncbi:hypothetical protein D1872_113750 [compost metagenome]